MPSFACTTACVSDSVNKWFGPTPPETFGAYEKPVVVPSSS